MCLALLFNCYGTRIVTHRFSSYLYRTAVLPTSRSIFSAAFSSGRLLSGQVSKQGGGHFSQRILVYMEIRVLLLSVYVAHASTVHRWLPSRYNMLSWSATWISVGSTTGTQEIYYPSFVPVEQRQRTIHTSSRTKYIYEHNDIESKFKTGCLIEFILFLHVKDATSSRT
jgi:hypothetical protein